MAGTLTLKARCPHCNTRDQAFAAISAYAHERYEANPLESVLFSCNGCSHPVAVTLVRNGHSPSIWGKSIQLTPDYASSAYSVLWVYPKATEAGVAPEYTPPNIASFFNQATKAQQEQSWDLAGMGFGKAMDTATKKLIRDIDGNESQALKLTLQKRIDWLHGEGKLTDDLKDWAHIVRIERNDASHEEEPYSQGDTETLKLFTEVFLTYVFTLPARINAYRNTSTS